MPPGDTVFPSPYGLPPQEAREKLKSLTLTHFADDPPSAPCPRPWDRRPLCRAFAGPVAITQPGTGDAADGLSRLSPPLGSTERHVPGTHGDAPTSQDWGVWGWGSSGHGREADGEEKAPPAPQRRSSLGPRSRQPRRGAPITGFHLHTPGRPRLPGNARPSPVLP